MESVGFFLNEEWDSLTKMFSTNDHQESDFAMQFMINHDLFPSSSTFSLNNEGANYSAAPHQEVDHESNVYINNNDTLDTTNFFYFSQESSNSSHIANGGSNNISSFPTPNADDEHHLFLSDNNLTQFLSNSMSESIDFSTMDDNNNNNNNINTNLLSDHHVMEDSHLLPKEEIPNLQLENSVNLQDHAIDDRIEEVRVKRKFEQLESPPEDNKNNVTDNPKKKTRVSKEAQKKKKKAEPKKNPKKLCKNGSILGEAENNNVVTNGQSSSSYSSEEDDSKVALNSNGKARAGRGSATDPQSLYARKRRERINERLRILQNIVPNGTKVDISTMLEEAVHYVKFLQLQIKLLSSDDMWMYAPIAYNGMDMGLYQRISPAQ